MTRDSNADRQRKGKPHVRICMMPERNTRECVLLALGLRRSMRLRDRKHDCGLGKIISSLRFTGAYFSAGSRRDAIGWPRTGLERWRSENQSYIRLMTLKIETAKRKRHPGGQGSR